MNSKDIHVRILQDRISSLNFSFTWRIGYRKFLRSGLYATVDCFLEMALNKQRDCNYIFKMSERAWTLQRQTWCRLCSQFCIKHSVSLGGPSCTASVCFRHDGLFGIWVCNLAVADLSLLYGIHFNDHGEAIVAHTCLESAPKILIYFPGISRPNKCYKWTKIQTVFRYIVCAYYMYTIVW